LQIFEENFWLNLFGLPSDHHCSLSFLDHLSALVDQLAFQDDDAPP